MNHFDDQDLAIRQNLKDRDREVWDRTIIQLSAYLFAVANRKLHDAYLAEDAVQETWLKAWARIDTYDPQCSFKNWLPTICVRTAFDDCRRRQRQPGLLPHEARPESTEESPPVAAMKKEVRLALVERINQLTAKLREAIELEILEDLSKAEIAKQLNITGAICRKRCFDARRKLRESLEQKGIHSPLG